MDDEFPLVKISDDPERWEVRPGARPVFRRLAHGGFAVETPLARMADALEEDGWEVFGAHGHRILCATRDGVERTFLVGEGRG